MKCAIVLDDLFLRHQTPPGHPERPDRLRSVAAHLHNWKRFAELTVVPPSEAEESWLRAVHGGEMLDRVKATAGKLHGQLDPDTHTGPHSFQTALLAAGSVVRLLGMVLSGEAQSGFALVRPPGHHAESGRSMGFCLFNNIAVSAQWAIERRGLERIAVIDFDVHHGNGTQQIFEDRADVLYLSTHQFPLYPGTGSWEEQGSGKGIGTTVNFPISAGRGNGFYLNLFDEFVIPILERYHPQLVLVSAGYDAHREDPLANMNLDEQGFGELAARLNQLARQQCEGRILYVLEGGYHLQALAASLRRTIEVTLNESLPEPSPAPSPRYQSYARRAREALIGE